MSYYDDDFGLEEDDEFGISERKVARLMKRRSRLQALLPISGQARQRLIAKRIRHIDRVLARSGYSAEQAASQAAIAASGIEGIGGLQFQAMAPPGIGRLLRLPFYPATAHVGSTTQGGDNGLSTTNPVMIENRDLDRSQYCEQHQPRPHEPSDQLGHSPYRGLRSADEGLPGHRQRRPGHGRG